LVAGIVGVRDQGDAGRQQFGTGRIDRDIAVRAGEPQAMKCSGNFPVDRFGLGDRGLEGHIPQRRRFGAVRLAAGEVTQKCPLRNSLGALVHGPIGQ
jgi:hypothetical protein